MNFSPSTSPVVLDPKLVAQSVKASLDQFLALSNFAANLLNRRVGAWGETTKIPQQAAYPSVFSLFLSLFLLPLWKIFRDPLWHQRPNPRR